MEYSDLELRILTADDAKEAANLSASVGWNQTIEQWRAMIIAGHSLTYVERRDRAIAATAIVTPYGHQYSWISMVLVHPAFRRRGLGTGLLKCCIDWSSESDLSPLLDATREGRLVYKELGFRDCFSIARYRGTPSFSRLYWLPMNTSIRTLEESELTSIIDRESEVLGYRREFVYQEIFHGAEGEIYVIARDCHQIDGFAAKRFGSDAIHVGPIIGSSLLAAQLLFEHIARIHPGEEIIVDVVENANLFRRWLCDLGMTIERSFERMVFSGKELPLSHDELFATAGPEFG